MPNRFEPISTTELIASPSILSCFQELGCYELCSKVQKIKIHPQLTKLFSLRLHRHKVHLAGVRFELTTSAISKATGIPGIGERWFKQKHLDLSHYHPFLKPSCQVDYKTFSLFLIYWIYMPSSWRLSWNTSPVKVGSPESIPIILDSSCISPELSYCTCPTTFTKALRKCPPSCKNGLHPNKCQASFTIPSSK